MDKEDLKTSFMIFFDYSCFYSCSQWNTLFVRMDYILGMFLPLIKKRFLYSSETSVIYLALF